MPAMKIVIEYVAMLRVNGPASGSMMDVSSGSTISDLLDQLGISSDHQHVIIPFINLAKASRSKVLSAGDRVFLSMPVGGG